MKLSDKAKALEIALATLVDSCNLREAVATGKVRDITNEKAMERYMAAMQHATATLDQVK